jgi:hypothetical protein
VRSRYANRRSPDDQHRWDVEKAESEPFARTAPEVVYTETIDLRHCAACDERVRDCTCASEAPVPQPFRIRVEKLTQSGFIGEDLGQTFFAIDAMTASRNAKTVFGHLRPGWAFLAIPVWS